MTKATAIAESTTTQTIPTISYQVAMSQPTSHLFEVKLVVKGWRSSTLDLKMPVWTPGSYLVREYARHVQDFYAEDADKHSLASRKISKNHWEITTENISNITVCYRVFANELTVRTNHLDSTHGYFNGAALFFYIPGLEHNPITVSIAPPQSSWQVTTTLPSVPEETNTFTAKDFDTLVDSPFEIGTHRLYDFEAGGKPHQLAIWGEGNAKPTQIIEDIQSIIDSEADMYGGLPYDRYLFILHLSDNGFGGLEHKDSCSLNYPRFSFRKRDRYERFLQLVAHEFFHLWNVKRIRPKTLETFDYEGENYTTSLWFCEGATSYYDLLIPVRAGIYNSQTFLDNLSKDITKFLTIPGRKVQPLGESSFDAWIKLYRRDANSDNSQISYYLKGELVSLLLDLLIRARHHNDRSLDEVMRQMWDRFGKSEIGFTPSGLWEVIESVAETDLSEFRDRYINSTAELPFDEYLEPFGLQIKSVTEDEPVPDTGMKVTAENGKETIKFVRSGSPAAIAGIDAGDELLAINNRRVSAEKLSDRLKDYQAGDIILVSVFHQNELRSVEVKLAEAQPSRYEIVKVENPTETQKQNLAGWLG
ncbi:MAG: M61 family metallopeptidase [Prochloraceae cyanobacterium]|nr:M61 family metallopeptidase [Prochloraceae cyanobacterium]